jgi:hypothetical protein
MAGEKQRFQTSCKNQELIDDIPSHKEDLLPVRPVRTGKQLMVKVDLKDLHTWKTGTAEALVDSGCMRTCVNEAFVRVAGFTLNKIPKLIRVEYADGTSVEESTIRYAINLRI